MLPLNLDHLTLKFSVTIAKGCQIGNISLVFSEDGYDHFMEWFLTNLRGLLYYSGLELLGGKISHILRSIRVLSLMALSATLPQVWAQGRTADVKPVVVWPSHCLCFLFQLRILLLILLLLRLFHLFINNC